MVTLRRAAWADAWRLWRWRNDPTTRAMMRATAPVGLAEHVRWLRAALRGAGCALYVAEASAGGWSRRRVGTGRIDFVRHLRTDDLLAELSVTVAPAWRGCGFAPLLVVALAGEAARLGCQRSVATIRAGNEASLRAFARAGFVRARTDDPAWVTMERRC